MFTNSDWTAQLYRLSGDESQVTYRFEFTKWRDALSNASLMNMLMTAIEKLFLELDPNTQVRTVPLDVKTKHSFL